MGFALDFAFVFSRVEHVERVVARGLLDDEHEALLLVEPQTGRIYLFRKNMVRPGGGNFARKRTLDARKPCLGHLRTAF